MLRIISALSQWDYAIDLCLDPVMPYVLGIISAHYQWWDYSVDLSQALDVCIISAHSQWDYAVDLCLDPVMPCVLGIISAVSVALCCRFLPPVWWIFGLFAFTPSTLHLPSHPQVLCIFVCVRFHNSGTAFPICFESVACLGLFTLTSVALHSPSLP